MRPEKTSVWIKDKQGRRVWSGSNWKLQPPHSKPPNRLLSVSAKSTEMPLETGKTQMLMVATSWLWQLPSLPPPWSSQAWEGREGVLMRPEGPGHKLSDSGCCPRGYILRGWGGCSRMVHHKGPSVQKGETCYLTR